jgi:ubiquitin carboxyl-terminal hydrolase L3
LFSRIQLEDGHLKEFLNKTKTLNPEERGELLQNSEGIMNTHKELALEGQTKVRTLHLVIKLLFKI